MTWSIRLAWGLVAIATLIAAVAAFSVRLPEPSEGIAIERAIYLRPDGVSDIVTLPHKSGLNDGEQVGIARYRLHFNLEIKPEESLFLFVPAVNSRTTITLNGEKFFDMGARTILSGPMVSAVIFVSMPQVLINQGRNDLELSFETRNVALARHLSRVFVGTESQLISTVRLRVFLQERLITMALGAQILLGLSILLLYFLRPTDPLFLWLAALVVVATVVSIGLFVELPQGSVEVRLLAVSLSTGVGSLFIAIAYSLVGVSPPRGFYALAIFIPVAVAAFVVTGILHSLPVAAAVCFPIFFLMLVAGSSIVAWGAIRRGNIEAQLMLSPFILICCFGLRDLLVGVGLLDGSVLITPYVRPLFLGATMAVLMRRLALSLHHLDFANEHLAQKLGEREAQLALLHRQERIEAARAVREQERVRLTRDLHDGISGHLVSIIAMAERDGSNGPPIEQAARSALDDLRLVIYSLDIGDRELPLALASFRERLIPQLQRMGVALDWSTAELPDVTGVTPGNALTILRILQEAITNALKHGPARRIVIRGAPLAASRAAIMIENDGSPFAPVQTGRGLQNMRTRADQLKGQIEIHAIPSGTCMTLVLPTALPDLENDWAG